MALVSVVSRAPGALGGGASTRGGAVSPAASSRAGRTIIGVPPHAAASRITPSSVREAPIWRRLVMDVFLAGLSCTALVLMIRQLASHSGAPHAVANGRRLRRPPP